MNYKELLGTDLPIIQALMAGVQGSSLAIAVSEAGGLGSLPCGMLSTEKIISEIEVFKESTRKPYNLNFFCHDSLPYNENRQAIWRNALTPYFTELGSEVDLSFGSARVPFSHDIADAIECFSPPFMSFYFRLPNKDLLQ